LEYDVENRISASEALFHPYFTNLSQTITYESFDRGKRNSVQGSSQKPRFSLENLQNNDDSEDDAEGSLDDICPDLNQIAEEKKSFTPSLSHLQNGLKGIKIHFPTRQIHSLTSVSCLKFSEKSLVNSQQHLNEVNLTLNEKELYGNLLLIPHHSDLSETQNLTKSFGFSKSTDDDDDESEVACDEGPDMNSKLKSLRDFKRPSRHSKIFQEENIAINRIIG